MGQQKTLRLQVGVLSAFAAVLYLLSVALFPNFVGTSPSDSNRVLASSIDSENFSSGSLSSEQNCARMLIQLVDAIDQEDLGDQLALLRLIVDDWSLGNTRVHTQKEVNAFKQQLEELQDSVLISDDANLQRSYVDLIVAVEEYRERPANNGAFSKIVTKTRAFLAHSFLLRPLGAVAIRRPRVSAKINLKIRELEMLPLREMGEEQIENTLRRLSFLRTFQKESYSSDFNIWLSVKRPWKSVSSQSRKSLGEFYSEQRSAHKAEARGFSGNKEDAAAFSKIAKERNWSRYETLRTKTLGNITAVADFEDSVLQLLESFKSLDGDFKAQEFFVWLESKGHLNSLGEVAGANSKLSLGEWLQKEYLLFAPYSKQPMTFSKATAVRVKQQVRDISRQLVGDIKKCKERSCYAEVFRQNFSRHFRGSYIMRPFSCLRKNPLIVKSLIMDNSIAFSALAAYYYYNRPKFDRFPVELVFNAVLFSPALSEAYCRASFRSRLSFGDKLLSKNVFPGKTQKMASFRQNLNMLVGRGAMFSAGLVGFTYAFDQLYLALGGELARTVTFKENLMTLPFIFLHAAVWSSAKNLAFVNPLRHKLIPKLSESVAEKLGKRRLGVGIQTALDAAIYFPISKYNSWEYLYAYRQQIMPAMMGFFGISVMAEKNEDKEPNTESVAKVDSESFKENDQSIQIHRKLSNGVESSLELEKLDNGNVRLKSVDIDMPDGVLESLATHATEAVDEAAD